jgi:MoxR-like ATPase
MEFGASPRASIALAQSARALAFLQGRGYVVPEDVRAISLDVLRHRIGLSYEAEAEQMGADDLLWEVLNAIAIP